MNTCIFVNTYPNYFLQIYIILTHATNSKLLNLLNSEYFIKRKLFEYRIYLLISAAIISISAAPNTINYQQNLKMTISARALLEINAASFPENARIKN